jgi:hypothetical protein
VIRDDETGFAPIIRSTSVSKFSYLVGRFAGATAAALGALGLARRGPGGCRRRGCGDVRR